jgi:hypothetical protein
VGGLDEEHTLLIAQRVGDGARLVPLQIVVVTVFAARFSGRSRSKRAPVT